MMSGLMSKEFVIQMTNNTQAILQLQGSTKLLRFSFNTQFGTSNPTDQQIKDWCIANHYTDFSTVRITNIDTTDVWVYDTAKQLFYNAGQDTINTATNTTLGVVKGMEATDSNDGSIRVEASGNLWVNGWTTLKNAVTNVLAVITEIISNLDTEKSERESDVSSLRGNLNQETNAREGAITTLQNQIDNNVLTRIYPVGTIYETTNPFLNTPQAVSEQFGFGTWEEFGKGQVLVAFDNSITQFNTLVKSGGSLTNTLAIANLPSHNHTIPALTTGNQSANHTHTINHQHTHHGYRSFASGSSGGVKSREKISGDPSDYGGDAYDGNSGNNSVNHTHTTTATNTGNTGSDGAINNLQPYIVVYRYRRTI
jgi:microcystin-dependent protein